VAAQWSFAATAVAVVELCVSIKALTVLVGVKPRMVQTRIVASMPVKASAKQPLLDRHTPVTIALRI